jgi:sterol desaturase/sphingolipid hydroxylase (fatty acid hydroxylase superfamily)
VATTIQENTIMSKSRILSIAVVPTLLFATGLVSYLAIQRAWNLESVAMGIFLFSAIYILLLEQIIPLKEEWKSRKTDLWSNLKHLLFSTVIFDALGKTLALSFVLWIKTLFFETPEIWSNIPLIYTFLLAVLIGEFLPYIYHRISHQGKESSYLSLFLWRIHSIHHIPKSLNWFKANWMHPINMFLNTFLKIMPLLLLGFSEEVLFLVGILHVVIAYISHANIQSETSFLDYLIVTPKIHQFHHSENLEEAKNFGNIIPFWDILFSTYYNRKGDVNKVGVIESNIEYPKEERYLNQIAFPFINYFKNCCSKEKPAHNKM